MEGGSRILSPGKEEALDGGATENCDDHVKEIGFDDMLQMLRIILYVEKLKKKKLNKRVSSNQKM